MPHTLLFGGTFDPIHLGHLIIAQRAMELLHADRVLFVPAFISPHKLEKLSASPQHRIAMLNLAIAPQPAFAIDTREIARAGPSYTIDTLESLEREQPQERFTLLIGADQLTKLHTWHRAKELFELPPRSDRWAIVGRPSNGQATPGDPAVEWGTKLAAGRILATPLIEISATDIRNRIQRGLPIDFLVPPAVAEYIRQHHLYRT